MGINIHAMEQDNAGKGIPSENLASLKAFLAAKRQEPVQRKFSGVSLPEACRTLPADTQEYLAGFLCNIKNTHFLKPDGKPDEEWYVYYGKTWQSARANAVKAGARIGRMGAVCHRSLAYATQALDYAANMGGLTAAATQASDAAADRLTEVFRSKYAVAGTEGMRQARRDVGLAAKLIVVSDVDVHNEEIDRQMAHASRRWQVWEKGYALYADYDGTVIVYCAGKRPKE